MVSDVSSVVSDYLFSGKPFAMIAVPAEPDAFVAEFPVARASYVVRGDLADLTRQLDRMLGADPPGRPAPGGPRRLPRRLPGRGLRVGVRRSGPTGSWTRLRQPSHKRHRTRRSKPKRKHPSPMQRLLRTDLILLRAGPPTARLIIRMGLHLLGTICGLLAFATALAGGPPCPIALLGLAACGDVRSDRFASSTPGGRWWAALLASGMALAGAGPHLDRGRCPPRRRLVAVRPHRRCWLRS